MKIQVALIMGGVSTEHEISVISALQTYHAINKEKYDVIPVYITKTGRMVTGEKLCDIGNFENMNALLSSCRDVMFCRKEEGTFLTETEGGLLRKQKQWKIDVAFPVVHGTNCEDGTVQGLCEAVRLPYVGCDILGSALGMDKAVMKQVLSACRIPVVPYTVFSAKDFGEKEQNACEELGYPLIVKPVNLGSSVGIRKVENTAELQDAVTFAGSFSTRIIVEKAVCPLREINCSVLGDYEFQETSALEEPVQNDAILSYNDKYVSGGKQKGMQSLKRKTPDDLSEEKQNEIHEMAKAAFRALCSAGVARIDFLMDDKQNVFVNEINTIPGSLSFYLWEARGKSFSALCDDLITLALKRKREKEGLTFSFDKNIFALKGTTRGITGKK